MQETCLLGYNSIGNVSYYIPYYLKYPFPNSDRDEQEHWGTS